MGSPSEWRSAQRSVERARSVAWREIRRVWLKPPVSKLAWWYEHMGNMLTACIGTVTAFLVVNVPRLGLERYALVFWLPPGVLGGIGIALWQRRYRMKLEPNRGS